MNLEDIDSIPEPIVRAADEERGVGEYRSTLYFTPKEWAALAPVELEAMKQARYDDWVAQQLKPEPTPAPAPVDPNAIMATAMQATADAFAQAAQQLQQPETSPAES